MSSFSQLHRGGREGGELNVPRSRARKVLPRAGEGEKEVVKLFHLFQRRKGGRKVSSFGGGAMAIRL